MRPSPSATWRPRCRWRMGRPKIFQPVPQEMPHPKNGTRTRGQARGYLSLRKHLPEPVYPPMGRVRIRTVSSSIVTTLPCSRSSATTGSTSRSRDATISGAVLEIRTVTRLGRSRPDKARRSEKSKSCVQTTRSFSAAYDRMASSELSSERGVDTRTVSQPASVKAATVIGEIFMSARNRRGRVTKPSVVIVQRLSTQRIALPAERLPPPIPDTRPVPLQCSHLRPSFSGQRQP